MSGDEPTAASAVVVPPPKPLPVPKQSMTVSVDRNALRAALGAIANPGAKQDWCIACGAGKSANPLDKVEAVAPMTKELLGGKTLPEFLESLKDFGKQAWCIACGAGKDASPLDLLGDPEQLPDTAIDALAARFISAVRVS